MELTLIYHLNQLKNAAKLKKLNVSLKFNRKFLSLVLLLYKEGYLKSFFVKDSKINIDLLYFHGYSPLSNLILISKLSHPRYLNTKDLLKINIYSKLFILSTHKGFLTLLECNKNKIGGKAIFVC